MKNLSDLLLRGALAALAVTAVAVSGVVNAAEPSPSPKSSDTQKADAKKEVKAQLSDDDKDFMMKAAKDGMREVHMGQMAQKQGKSAEVKKLGNMIVSDHTKANNELTALAKRKGVTLDTKHDMDKIDDDDFDKDWLSMMVKDHEKDIAAFEKQAKNGTDGDVKNFANKTTPVLKKHLKAVQDAQKKLESSGDDKKKSS